MHSLNHRFRVLYNVILFASSWDPHFLDNITDKITLYLKARVYTVLARHINKTYDHGNTSKYTELLLVTANERFIRLCSCASYCTIPICLRVQVIRISV